MATVDDLISQIQGLSAEQIAAQLRLMPPPEFKRMKEAALAAAKDMKWIPNQGPQTQAYLCKADILLYGGSGGSGKSDLGLGLALTQHKRSLILRRKYTNLGSIIERAIEINGTRDGFNGSPPPILRTTDNRLVQFAGNNQLGDEQDWQGQPFDLKVFDETTQFLEAMVRFHLGWMRSTDPNQRCRVVMPTNPPIDSDGDWIIGFFRPWLDITHPNPAKPGELRWFVTAPDGTDLEVPDGRPIQLPGKIKPSLPMSRCFIPGKLSDNPYLLKTNYEAVLDGLPEPLRSAVRDGNFMANRKDADFQVIPTAWVIAAQERWTKRPPAGVAMTAIALDPAGGGRDSAEIAIRHGGWYDNLISEQGEETADGSRAAAVVVRHRRDSCGIVVDVGGGYGGGAIMRLKDNGIECMAFNGSTKTTQKSKDKLLTFYNLRAATYWKFREELDPSQEGGSSIALPPDPELRADLCAPTWELTTRGILVESKDELRKRLGRSPGKGDAVVMCLSEGSRAAMRMKSISSGPPRKAESGTKFKVRRYS